MSVAPQTIGQTPNIPTGSTPGGSTPGGSTPAARTTLQVPARWRAGQLVVIALIALLAIYYIMKGSRPVPGGPAVPPPAMIDYLAFALLAGMTWLSTPNVGVIALTTLQEAIRRRWVVVMLVFGVAVLLGSSFLTGLQPGEEEKFLRDFGVGFIITIMLLMAIFLGAMLVPPEIDRRIIFTILSKPVTRLEFLLGKFLGLCLTLFLNLAILGTVFLIVYFLFKVSRVGYEVAATAIPNARTSVWFDVANLANALWLLFGQLAMMSALALCLSLVVSTITAIVFSFICYFGGQMSSYWESLGDPSRAASEGMPGVSKGMRGVVNVVHFLLPPLDRFDVRTQLVNDEPIGFSYVWKAGSSGLIYIAVLLTISYLVFSDREF